MANIPLPKYGPVYGFDKDLLNRSMKYMPKAPQKPVNPTTTATIKGNLGKGLQGGNYMEQGRAFKKAQRKGDPLVNFFKQAQAGARMEAGREAYEPPTISTRAAERNETLDNVSIPKKVTPGPIHGVPEKKGLLKSVANFGKDPKTASAINNAIPYLSNAVNALRKPPAPVKGAPIKDVSMQRVNMDQERAEIDRGTRAADIAAENIGGQTAAAIQGANKARAFEAKGASYSRENQMNAGIANQQASINANIGAQNAARQDAYNNDVLGMKMAQQRTQSQNLANLSDKMVAEQNRNAAVALEERKFDIMSKAYTNGVVDRLVRKVGDNPLGISAMGGKLKKVYAAGGTLGGGDDPKKPAPAKPAATTAPKTTAPLSTQEMNEWNGFIDYVKGKGMSGSKDLDNRDKGLGAQLFNEYKTANPNTSIDYSVVPRAQAEFHKFQKFNNDFEARKTGKAAPDQFDNISKEDGWFGSITSQQRLIPLVKQQTDANGNVVSRANAGLMNGEGKPTSAMNTTGSPSGLVLPKGAKLEQHTDGWKVQEYDGGDWVPVGNYTAKHAMGGKLGRMRGRIKKVF